MVGNQGKIFGFVDDTYQSHGSTARRSDGADIQVSPALLISNSLHLSGTVPKSVQKIEPQRTLLLSC